jgi:histidyl-tRNA synthetase
MREFWQADADVVGSDSMDCDAECLAVATTALKELGFREFKIRLNNRKILDGLIRVAGVDKKEEAFRSLDKLEKIGKSGVLSEMKEKGIKPEKAEKLLKLIEISGKPKTVLKKGKGLLKGIKIAQEGIKELEDLVNSSKVYGIEKMIVVDFSLVRGLDYYTGPIFEISVKAKREIGSIAGGGRYDNLIGLFGKPEPATGFSFGIERVFEIMDSEKMFKGIPNSKTRVFVAAAKDEPRLRKEAIITAQKLRAAGIPAETDLMGRKLKQCFGYAEKLGIPCMIIIGEKELKSGRLVLRDLKKREQKVLGFGRILKGLKMS